MSRTRPIQARLPTAAPAISHGGRLDTSSRCAPRCRSPSPAAFCRMGEAEGVCRSGIPACAAAPARWPCAGPPAATSGWLASQCRGAGVRVHQPLGAFQLRLQVMDADAEPRKDISHQSVGSAVELPRGDEFPRRLHHRQQRTRNRRHAREAATTASSPPSSSASFASATASVGCRSACRCTPLLLPSAQRFISAVLEKVKVDCGQSAW